MLIVGRKGSSWAEKREPDKIVTRFVEYEMNWEWPHNGVSNDTPFSMGILVQQTHRPFLISSISLRSYGEHQGMLGAPKLKQSLAVLAANSGSVTRRSAGKENNTIVISQSKPSSRHSYFGFLCL